MLNNVVNSKKLYKKLSNFHKINKDNLYLAGGIDLILRGFFELFISKNDSIILTRPTFLMYDIYAKIFKAKIHYIDYNASLNGPTLDIDKFYKLIDLKKPRAVFLANPNSPTGTVLKNDDLFNLIKYCNQKKILFFLDEAYYLFYNKSYYKLTNKFNNLIVVRTFSKSWGLAGIRAGYAFANKKIIDQFNAVAPMYPLNSVAIYLIENLLDNYSEIKKSVKKLIVSKNYFIKELQKLGYKSYKTHGNFCNINFNGKEKIIYNKLKNKITYKVSFNHKSLKSYSRFSLTDKNNFKKILNLISE